MTLAERLRDAAGPYNDSVLVYVESALLTQAADRIEAADDVIEHGNAASHARYRALVREQEASGGMVEGYPVQQLPDTSRGSNA